MNAPTRRLVPSPNSETVVGTPSDYDLVRRAIGFLSAEFLEQPDLGRLAHHLGLDATQCQKLFKRWCGLSPKEFVQALTLDHARRLLADSASVLAASHESGLTGGGRLHDLFVTWESMTPGEAKRLGAGLSLAWGRHPTPFGDVIAAATPRGLAALAFIDDENGADERATREGLAARWPNARFVEDRTVTAPMISRIFGEPDRTDTTPLRLILIGTDWEVRVWDALLKVPLGHAVSYRDVARTICTEKAARAVGAAVGKNPIAFVVPCHRVLNTDGRLGGYHWGLTRKRALIGWEAGQLKARR
ncbi:MAG: bifunctional helix-turn-helix domain-containing protein/methylated-DNA--[protein]-cysteine S-methyltransferase [Hyphomicrobium sp.]|nr:bifunctional helix-turn-helix domain-containing protein/methylated-DNA--[protein]-cysteine S-methyltransferase [Hyphomicrobium sp.]